MKKATHSETPSAKPAAKKVSAKAAPAPAPAPAPVPPTPAPAATPVAATPKPAPAKPAVKKEVVKKPAAPAVNGPTVVVARVDVGFGNVLFVRGDGPGLSWERGVPMDCVASDQWTWSTATASRPFAYKVLINDERWSAGEDYVAEVGVENTISPAI